MPWQITHDSSLETTVTGGCILSHVTPYDYLERLSSVQHCGDFVQTPDKHIIETHAG